MKYKLFTVILESEVDSDYNNFFVLSNNFFYITNIQMLECIFIDIIHTIYKMF